MTTTNDVRQGVGQRITDPTGTKYLLHVAPSGSLGFSVHGAVHGAQGPIEALVRRSARRSSPAGLPGRRTVLAWRSDV